MAGRERGAEAKEDWATGVAVKGEEEAEEVMAVAALEKVGRAKEDVAKAVVEAEAAKAGAALAKEAEVLFLAIQYAL
ncbi:hypothetical protein GPECTOR_18g14 [Gonium pectorale]|uniref:Uncharacterized protein n=1 Tax=Gonium pectorale TaxID=33097 RepID=A0A150GJQ7_GONPE|nr:hypothetical protein GPECTOR_18g14 [Gonium pectorale]|eukprot:KXZ49984.1 hypothetical protein GPECTOR_18g14 [Gonium pectorale]